MGWAGRTPVFHSLQGEGGRARGGGAFTSARHPSPGLSPHSPFLPAPPGPAPAPTFPALAQTLELSSAPAGRGQPGSFKTQPCPSDPKQDRADLPSPAPGGRPLAGSLPGCCRARSLPGHCDSEASTTGGRPPAPAGRASRHHPGPQLPTPPAMGTSVGFGDHQGEPLFTNGPKRVLQSPLSRPPPGPMTMITPWPAPLAPRPPTLFPLPPGVS